ncbi:RNA-binding protein [Gallaecimonas kandeliae]|uniref:RNA recognition motif domain-containing protein n=1 Tax=Gallaecimonas kandeliae TaxID=3029055 RepID=UPI00264914D6|nr:RNA-binding protein [Gallaecimonas kandeliae]WKE65955.1 RNA-binding protein [Gallaecimonas kandeliae]
MPSIIILIVLAVLGYFLSLLIPAGSAPQGLFFAAGILLGGLAMYLLTRPKTQASGTEDATTVTLYVGNLPYRANEQAVQQAFERFGKVVSVRLMKDRQTGRRRGFGFVEMLKEDAQAAIKGLNDAQFQDRTLKVREAKDRKEQEED